ncbi:unnamed protein product [Leptosia nina]|uniref:RING-type E3 ubiquitin transferase n=1 Tax=Leptosia nina TaxID=320188 RepID=A0AAV1JHP8_9NEOP
MAAKSKKRLTRNENKLNKLDNLEIKDVICSICQSILIEPVTLPCFHNFCERCFHGSIENNALCCPLCRLRIGSWVRTATKQKNLVNIQLWNSIKNKFSQEVNKKLNGEDLRLSPDKVILRLSKPGEIRSEYETEMQRLKAERIKVEQAHIQETVFLIKKLKEEEEEAHRKYLESLKNDEILAKKLQEEHPTQNEVKITEESSKKPKKKSRLKSATLDGFLSNLKTNELTRDNPSTEELTPKKICYKASDVNNTERLNTLLPGKSKDDKENGKNCHTKDQICIGTEKCNEKNVAKTKNGMQSLLVSLPLPPTGILQHKTTVGENRNNETGSVDSMQQELCYFKPIEGTTPTSFKSNKGLPLRVPGLKLDTDSKLPSKSLPTREQYLENLCQLRQISLAKKLPSAFVITLSILRAKKMKKEKSAHIKVKENETSDIANKLTENSETFLRRTRSMGSISKIDNETTPKKRVSERKSESERKVYLRSESKRYAKKNNYVPPLTTESSNNNKVNLAVKNLSSPIEDCGVKHILQEQLRIEKLIQQEKCDYELACKMDAEWNGRRQPRRAATKRQVTLSYALRPAKKVRV